MSSTIQNKNIDSFIEQWKKHPMSIPIVILIMNSSFLLVLIQGQLEDNKVIIASITCAFNLLVLIIVVTVLLRKKFVFYNATELVVSELDIYIKNINESLSGVEIGYGTAFEHILAPPISQEAHAIIKNFELLSGILKSIDYEFDENDLTKKALAKYYYRTKKYLKALDWSDKVKDKKDSEYNFIQGLVHWRLKEPVKAREHFAKSSHENAKYYAMLTYIDRVNPIEADLNHFISEVTNNTNPLFSNFFAQLNLGTAYWLKATVFPSDGKVVDISMLEKAFSNAERLSTRDTNGFSYFNAACYKSLIGKYCEGTNLVAKFDSEKCCNEAIRCLTIALNLGPSLVKLSAKDSDLEWLKEKCPSKFYELIGANCRRCAGEKS